MYFFLTKKYNVNEILKFWKSQNLIFLVQFSYSDPSAWLDENPEEIFGSEQRKSENIAYTDDLAPQTDWINKLWYASCYLWKDMIGYTNWMDFFLTKKYNEIVKFWKSQNLSFLIQIGYSDPSARLDENPEEIFGSEQRKSQNLAYTDDLAPQTDWI